MLTVLQVVYAVSTVILAIVGVNALVLAGLYAYHHDDKPPAPPRPVQWPDVVVQLPIYNERHVVERLLQAVAALDYPADKLTIQLLDDSTDDTCDIAAEAIATCGMPVMHIRRPTREGYKAGALAYGLGCTDAAFVAMFDADFVPPTDFLKRVMPYFVANRGLGLVQTRWAHLNATESTLTRAQALALDAHFVVEQTARHRAGLLMNFAGTGGVWRREAITAAGGWQADTLSEDIDLSYRAQLGGWECLYLPDYGVRGEVPALMMGFKRQQARWATGTVQCFRKLSQHVLRADLTAWQKYQAMIHLGGYVIHPLMLIVLLLTLPLLLLEGLQVASVAGLGIAMFGPPVQAVLSQSYLYEDWRRRLLYFPAFLLMGIGITVNNTAAFIRGWSRKPQPFERTPKFHVTKPGASRYRLAANGSTWVEVGLGLYALVAAGVSLRVYPAVVPFMLLYACGFFYVAVISLSQTKPN